MLCAHVVAQQNKYNFMNIIRLKCVNRPHIIEACAFLFLSHFVSIIHARKQRSSRFFFPSEMSAIGYSKITKFLFKLNNRVRLNRFYLIWRWKVNRAFWFNALNDIHWLCHFFVFFQQFFLFVRLNLQDGIWSFFFFCSYGASTPELQTIYRIENVVIADMRAL